MKRLVPFEAVNHILAGIKYENIGFMPVEIVEFADGKFHVLHSPSHLQSSLVVTAHWSPHVLV